MYLLNTNGLLLATITNAAASGNDGFGASLAALGNNLLAIGAPYHMAGTNPAPSIYLFNTNGSLLTTITNPTPTTHESGFGVVMGVVGNDKLIVGDRYASVTGNETGAAYLYSTNGTLLVTFTNPVPQQQEYFGYSVAGVGQDRVLVSAPQALAYSSDGQSNIVGAAYLFLTNGTLLARFAAPYSETETMYGYSVAALGGDRLVITKPADSTAAMYAGSADLFWQQSFSPGVIADGVRNGSITAASLADGAITASKIVGQLGDSQLSTNVALLNRDHTFTGSNVFSGVVTFANPANALAGNFTGDGSGLLNLNASQLIYGTVPPGRLPAAVITNNQSAVTLAGTFSGSGAGLTNVPLSALAVTPLTNNQSGASFKGTTTVSNLVVTATNFVNYLVVTNPPALNGSAITNLNAAQLATGTVPLPLLPAAVVTNNETGVSLAGTFTGNGAGLTNIPFSALPGIPLTNSQSGVTLKGLTTVSNLSVTATNFVNYLVVTNPPALNGSAITNLNAAQLAFGTVPLAQLPGAVLTNNQTGVALTGAFTGNGVGLTNIPLNALSTAPLTNNQSGVTLTGAFTGNGAGLTNIPLKALSTAPLTNSQSGVTLTGSFTGNAGGLTNLDATDLTGTIADARLSINVPLLNASQAFTGSNRFAGVVTLTNTSNTLAGNGAGLTNIIPSANYVFSYSTATQAVVSAGTFQDITCNVDPQIDGWSHASGTASFTNNQTGLYWVQYKGQVQFNATSASETVSLRAIVGAAEIAGSDAAVYAKKPAATSADDWVTPVSASFITSFTSGNVLKFQITGASGSSLIPNTGYSTTRPSFSCTIMRLK